MAITSILDTSNKTPGAYLRVSLGVGPRSAGDAPRKVIVYGNKTSAGSAAVGSITQVLTEDDAKSLNGPGSELHLMVRSALRVNRNVDLSAAVIAEAGTAATATITFTGGPSTAAGTVEIWIGGVRVVTTQLASGSTITQVAAAVEAAIDENPDLPVTALAAAGVVTVTAKNTGPRGNFISIRTKVTGLTAVSHSALNTYLSAGATMDDPANAIAAAQPQRWHLHAVPYATATELSAFKAHVASEAEPEVGQRETVVAGSIDTLANTITLATGQNAEREQIAWLYNGDSTPGEIAAALAAFRAKAEGADPSVNTIGSVLPGIQVPYGEADWPTSSELVSALNNGITPLAIVNGTIQIVRSITSKSQDSGGNPDYAVLDTHKVTVPDFVADTLSANWPAFADGAKAGQDPAEGAPEEGILTPKIVKDWIYGILKEMEAATHLEPGSVDERVDEIIVELAEAPAGRFNAVLPLDVIEHAAQFAGDVRQVG